MPDRMKTALPVRQQNILSKDTKMQRLLAVVLRHGKRQGIRWFMQVAIRNRM
ncbi:hypothetical protein [Candidatus Jettenia sp. AMX1]|uniref:hypothetical protein n=1 Tax=Candidatus Jettenia sp. AMX1 TaxID=2293637 RepID=UPI000324ACA9|nr:hypothetical protein [Candidatus Jettenia sp. AMX1]WKZ14126.1 MAG: hypothetical protein QY317_09410 [Candidatus Jettenia caeni]